VNDRARVPFALVGVLLLVGSATLTASMAPRGPPAAEPATERAVERTVAETNTALRGGVRSAARDAARNPVVVPANTSAGRALNASTPFRDALRLRIYLAARDRLDGVETHVDGVRATASLPPTDARRAIERVRIESAGPNGTLLRVRLRNVTVTAHRGDRVVERVVRNRTFVVRTPVLALHRRVEEYETRLNRGPLTPGLGRRLTAQLYPVAWARGYAQHGGAPISNVLANRHVALATNRGVLSLQRATLGTTDPAARRAVATAGERVAVRDLLAGASGPSNADLARRLLDAAADREVTTDALTAGPDGTGAPTPETPMRVGVNRTALHAFASLTGREGSLSSVLGSVYTVEARLVAEADRVGVEQRGTTTLSGWILVDERTTTAARVHDAPASATTAPPDWTVAESYDRRVVRTRTTVRTWRRGNRTRTTRAVRETTSRVSLDVLVRPAPGTPAAPRGIETAFERGAGPLDGPNLADAATVAVRRLVTARGPDVLARRAAAGTLDTGRIRVDATRPAGLREWVYADLATLRTRVRNVSVTTRRAAVGTHASNPPAMLAARLRERRDALLDAPETYGSAAAKARTAARAAYLDAVVASLEDRAAARRARATRTNETLAANGAGSLPRLRELIRTRPETRADAARPPLSLSVDGAPPYLTLAAVDRQRFGTGPGRFRPLAARNLNVFTTPHGDAADAVIGELTDPQRTDLRTAARTLRASRHLSGRDAALDRNRTALRREVERSNRRLRARIVAVLGAEQVGTARSRGEIVDTALARWPTPAARAVALTNGSAASAVVAVASEQGAVETATERDRLRVALRAELDHTRGLASVRVPQLPVERTANATRAVGTELLRQTVDHGVDRTADAARRRLLGRTLGSVPAGLPVAPVPGYWYATANVWHVQVRGAYDRFVVRAARGGPRDPLAYARDGRPVRLDVDGDGERERLGRAARLTFETSTTVLVVVPPSGTGVGDTDGQADERSAGWPDTGPG